MEMEGRTIILTTPQELSRIVSETLQSILAAPNFLAPSKRRFLTVKEIGNEFGIAKRTLEYWRKLGTGPEYTTIGGRVMYDRLAFEKYVADGTVRPADQLFPKGNLHRRSTSKNRQ